MFRIVRDPRVRHLRVALVIAVVLGVAVSGVALAASTTKSLSTNFTLINFGSQPANVHVEYLKEDGSPWTADAANTDFTIPANGGQRIVRQYSPFEGTMTTGRGSAVVNSDQPLGAVVQILARGQTPTSGAYSGFSQTSSTYYVPIVARRGSTASGLANSQIAIQNTDVSAVSVSVQFLGPVTYTRTGISIQPGATFYYDLDDETNLPTNWFGSAVVSASGGGKIAVVSNFFLGPDGLLTFNAFPAESLGMTWVVPLFTSRLANGLSTVVTVQNLSGGTIGTGAIVLNCVKDAAAPGPSTLTVPNASPVPNNGSYNFNPVVDTVNFPAGWYGACRVTSAGNVVAIVQMRYVGTPNSNAAAYEAMNASSTDKKVLVPLVAKRLANGFATVVTIQNLSTSSDAHVTLTYVPSPDYVASGGSSANIVVGPFTIPAGGSLLRNHRITSGSAAETSMPDGWYGSLTAVSSDQPIHGFVQLTNYLPDTPGDTFMAHNAFTQP